MALKGKRVRKSPPDANKAESKGKVAPNRTYADLTKKQIEKLAGVLRDTGGHVYNECEKLFGVRSGNGDVLFERLEAEAGLFKCVECNLWLGIDRKDRAVEGLCESCVDEIDGGPDEEE